MSYSANCAKNGSLGTHRGSKLINGLGVEVSDWAGTERKKVCRNFVVLFLFLLPVVKL